MAAPTRSAVFDRLHAALLHAAAHRHLRQDWVDVPGGRELAWVLHERQTMLAAVNAIRAEHGLPPVALAEVERVEQSACGHADYTIKFAAGCADLALDNTEETAR